MVRLRFSLKALIAFVALLCMLFAWLGFRYQRAQKQEMQRRFLYQYGGEYSLCRSDSGYSPYYPKRVKGFSFIDRWLGEEFTTHPIRVYLGRIHTDHQKASLIENNFDKQYEIITQMDRVVSLWIGGERAYTPEQAHYLRKMTDVVVWELEDINQEQLDSIMEALPYMRNLECFYMGDSYYYPKGKPRFSRDMIEVFADCPRLNLIWLGSAIVNYEAVEEIGTNPQLQDKEFWVPPDGLTEGQRARMKLFPNINPDNPKY